MAPASSTSRRPALDGLRGVAALVVVVHHCLLISPTLAAGYGGSVAKPGAGSWGWWLIYTPAHLFWAGGEAVVIFFVLSGLVLALRPVAWRSYYPQRLARLYLPVAGAVVLAYVLLLLVRRSAAASSSWWLAGHGPTASLRDVGTSVAVVFGTRGLNSALWSLKWEVIFSGLLPVFLLVFVRIRPATPLRLALLLAALVGSSFSAHDSLHYLPMFGVGVLMAQQLGWLDRSGRAFDSLASGLRVAVLVGALLLLLCPWLLQSSAVFQLGSRWQNGAGLVAELTGAAVIVWLAGCTGVGSSVGGHRAVQWLGLRSFSLYLVHEPIVVTVAYALGGGGEAALVLVIALPLSLLAAEVFGRLVEGPSHRLAKRLGRRRLPVAATAGVTSAGVDAATM